MCIYWLNNLQTTDLYNNGLAMLYMWLAYTAANEVMLFGHLDNGGSLYKQNVIYVEAVLFKS